MTIPVCQNWEIEVTLHAPKRRDKTTARINKSTVDGMVPPAAGTRSVLWDTELKCFGVRITANGVRTYVLRYRMGGADTPQRMLTIGRHGSPWTAELARKRAVELLSQVRLGTDNVAARDAAKATAVADVAARADRMFAAFADIWIKEHVQRDRLRSETDIKGVVERDLKPALTSKTIDEITKADVTAILNAIGDRSEAAANKAHKWLRAMYNWMIEKGHIDRSPLHRMGRPYKEGERTRVLRLGELVVLWVALEAVAEPFRLPRRYPILQRPLSWRHLQALPSADVDQGQHRCRRVRSRACERPQIVCGAIPIHDVTLSGQPRKVEDMRVAASQPYIVQRTFGESTARLHPDRRDGPQRCAQVDFRPRGAQHFTRARRCQNRKLQRTRRRRLPVPQIGHEGRNLNIRQRRMVAARKPLPLG
ncbi:Arm DNA-binding domain-containing protein [Sphingomonas solaris]|uniref:DUF4102 domain-containing protein n=1 Tax=Alterirhizorhabdus solaris TaxID=2529389 RepID=A0A558RAY6_9SPHN|nr:Arm DNA-binding domain-containing protein [Sphingomonas solaris]TVV76567.1 DUF4102 domain-containing protein [Sphingomonas solaris]